MKLIITTFEEEVISEEDDIVLETEHKYLIYIKCIYFC